MCVRASQAWHPFDCAQVGFGGDSAYAYWSGTAPACECRRFTELNPNTARCEPGCRDGAWGAQCQRTGACAFTWNADTTAMLRAATCEAVCRVDHIIVDGACAFDPLAAALPRPSSSSSSSDALSGAAIGIIVTVSVVGAFSLAAITVAVAGKWLPARVHPFARL